MKKNLLLSLLLLALLYSPVVFGQDEEKTESTFTLSGSVDAYFHSSLGTRVPGTDGFRDGYAAPLTSFANLKGFSLGMVNLIASYQGEKVGFTADLVFGPRGYDALFGTSTYTFPIPAVGLNGQRIINQMFVYYKLSDAVTLNLGQFNTFLGYEVISPAVNFHYSTSYLFSYGPFNHTGLRADFDLGGGLGAKLAIMNPTDVLEFNPVNTYTLGGQFGYSGDGGGIWLNVLYGDQDGSLDEDIDPVTTESAGKLFQVDLTTGWDISESFYLGINTSLQQLGVGQVVTATGVEDISGTDPTSFFGFAVYPKLTLSESTAIGLRAEYFSIKNNHLPVIGLDADGDGNVLDLTLSLNHTVGNLTIIPEFRMDKMSEDFFVTKDEATDSMLSFNLAAVYKF